MTNTTTSRPSRALAVAAERSSHSAYYLAYALRIYREGNGLTPEQLAALLECDPAEMASLALCRCPGMAGMDLEKDLDHLAARFRLNRERLADVVRFARESEEAK